MGEKYDGWKIWWMKNMLSEKYVSENYDWWKIWGLKNMVAKKYVCGEYISELIENGSKRCGFRAKYTSEWLDVRREV